MRRWMMPALLIWACAGTIGIASSQPRSQSGVAEGNALVKDVYGIAQQRKGERGDWKKLNVGDLLTPQTTLKTGDSAAILLQLSGNHVFRVGEKTTVELRELGKDNAYSFNVLAGNVWSLVRKASKPT